MRDIDRLLQGLIYVWIIAFSQFNWKVKIIRKIIIRTISHNYQVKVKENMHICTINQQIKQIT